VQAHLDAALSLIFSKTGVKSKCKRYDSSKTERGAIDFDAANLPNKNYKHKRKSVT
jgi:hypothetical protein